MKRIKFKYLLGGVFFLVFINIIEPIIVLAANPVAIPMKYYVVQNKGRHLMLSATSDDITFDDLVGPTPNWGTRYTSNRWGSSSAITSWTLDTLPSHGTLYNMGVAISAIGSIGNPDALYYKPEHNYVGNDNFIYHVVDAHGVSNSVKVSLAVAMANDYPMPLGINSPGFGIDEEAPADPPEWPSAEASGFYYFDNTNSNCSDANTYGYPDVPRCTLPFSMTLGNDNKAVFAPNSNTITNSSFVTVNFNSTQGHEAWLVGVDDTPNPPKITFTDTSHDGKNFRLVGGNYRITGLEFIDTMLRQYNSDGNNAVVRYSVLHDWDSQSGNIFEAGNGGTNILSFALFLYNVGTIDDDLARERDVHAFDGIDQHNWWILDCNVGSTAGDSLQITNNNTTSDIWVGRLTAHSPMENCVDIKDFNKVVITESNCWDIRKVTYGNSGGNAQNFYVNDEGDQQNFVYFINNRSWDSNGDLYASGNVGGTVYFIGNRGFFGPEATGFSSDNGSGGRIVHFNSFGDVYKGADIYNAGGSSHRWITGNYFDHIRNYGSFAMNYDTTTMDYNMYGTNNNIFAWGSHSNPTEGTFGEFKAVTGYGEHSEEGIQANLISASEYNFKFNQPSNLLNKIPADQITALFPGIVSMQSDLGIAIKDYLGTSRPQGAGWDIGAFEYIFPTVIRADVDQQNGITSTDAMLTLRNSLGLDMAQTNWQVSATTGDVNCDGNSNSTDAMLILRKSLGLDMNGTGWCN